MCLASTGEEPDEEGLREWMERIYNNPSQYLESEMKTPVEEMVEFGTEVVNRGEMGPLPQGLSSMVKTYGCSYLAAMGFVKCNTFRREYLRNFRQFIQWLNPIEGPGGFM